MPGCKDKCDFSRSDIFKIYRILCKRIHCSSLNYGFLTKMDKKNGGKKVIWADIYGYGMKAPLFTADSKKLLTLRKNAKLDDVQKEIVKKILKTLEKHSVAAGKSCISRNFNFEAALLKFDLAR